MTLHEKIKSMSLDEMTEEIEKIIIWGRNLSKSDVTNISTRGEGLKGYVREALQNEYIG